jgi:hypothetical protein
LPAVPPLSPRRQAGYRTLLPLPAWHAYLARATPNPALSALLAAAYLAFKAHALFRRGQLLLLATRLVLRTGAMYGRYLKRGELDACGGDGSAGGRGLTCPICRDAPSAPIRLDCSHVFCEVLGVSTGKFGHDTVCW